MLQTSAIFDINWSPHFKAAVATIRKHRIGSQEPGARSQERESSEQNSVENMTFRHSLRLFYCYCMLINNLEFQIYWQLYSDHDNKWSHVFSNSKIEVALSSCFGKNYSLYLSRSWKSSEVKSDLRADQFKETNKAWDTSRLACDKNSIFFFILESLLPGGVSKLRTNALPCWHQIWLS